MRRVALVGDIGSGKTFFSKLFGYPVFNADLIVSKLYRNDKLLFKKIKKTFPQSVGKFPLKKEELFKIILQRPKNLKVLGKIIHPQVRKRLKNFFRANTKKKFVILDIPLFLENRLNTKKDIVIFIDADKNKISKKINKRKNVNLKLIKILKKNQFPNRIKKEKSNFVIKNNFISKTAKKNVKLILNRIN